MLNQVDFKQTVYSCSSYKVTITLFAYGNGYRVKSIITDQDINDTHVIQSTDHEYAKYSNALLAYNNICELFEI